LLTTPWAKSSYPSVVPVGGREYPQGIVVETGAMQTVVGLLSSIMRLPVILSARKSSCFLQLGRSPCHDVRDDVNAILEVVIDEVRLAVLDLVDGKLFLVFGSTFR